MATQSEAVEAASLGTPGGDGSSAGTRAALRRMLLPFSAFVIVFLLWEAASRGGLVDELTLPPPSDVLSAFAEMFTSGTVWPHLGATVYETLAGFVVGAGGGFVIAVLSSFWEPFRRTVSPFMVAFQVMPRIALAPIFITWFGFGFAPKIVMAATICFFPVFVNTLTGLLHTDEEAMEMFRSIRASKRQMFTQLTLPSALPTVFAGLKTGMTLALIGAVVGEFVGTSQGLGYMIDRFTFRLDMAGAFAVVMVLTVVGLALYLLMEFLDRRIVFWTHDERLSRRRVRGNATNQGVPL